MLSTSKITLPKDYQTLRPNKVVCVPRRVPVSLLVSRLQYSNTMAAKPLPGAVEEVVAWCMAAMELRSL